LINSIFNSIINNIILDNFSGNLRGKGGGRWVGGEVETVKCYLVEEPRAEDDLDEVVGDQ